MNTTQTEMTQTLDSLLIEQFEANEALLLSNDSPRIKDLRKKHFLEFKEKGFPDSSQEKWRFTEIESALDQ